ncbi:CheR family methyltransferase [Novosphingobium pokkalii]|uniref:CheR family methyltransferase n=1 Tax=Novosphingobium pokkalii TaxID=1770194 RepID=UPI00362E1DFB
MLPPGKAMLVYSRLAPLVRDSGCQTFGAYVLRIREDAAERTKAICALTTNHTFFYREAHHFEHFAQEVRPHLIEKLDRGGKVRIWSAGCSSGEEVWSLVMTLLGADRSEGLKLARRDIRVLASDIATHAITKAQAARYRQEDLKPVPEPLRRAWTVPDGQDATIAPEAQALLRFRHLNLLGDWPMAGAFDVIFCRNVMIYFDNPTKERLVARFAESSCAAATFTSATASGSPARLWKNWRTWDQRSIRGGRHDDPRGDCRGFAHDAGHPDEPAVERAGYRSGGRSRQRR